jgi:hypothetical protein
MVSLRMFYSRTPKIKDINGKIKPNSVASLESAQIGGIDQWIIIRKY